MVVWRGRPVTVEAQVANACDATVDLTPATPAPAENVVARWSAVLSGQEIPKIGERYGYPEEQEPC